MQLFIGKKQVFHYCVRKIWLVKMSDHISESVKGSQGVANWRFKLQNSFIL